MWHYRQNIKELFEGGDPGSQGMLFKRTQVVEAQGGGGTGMHCPHSLLILSTNTGSLSNYDMPGGVWVLISGSLLLVEVTRFN